MFRYGHLQPRAWLWVAVWTPGPGWVSPTGKFFQGGLRAVWCSFPSEAELDAPESAWGHLVRRVGLSDACAGNMVMLISWGMWQGTCEYRCQSACVRAHTLCRCPYVVCGVFVDQMSRVSLESEFSTWTLLGPQSSAFSLALKMVGNW